MLKNQIEAEDKQIQTLFIHRLYIEYAKMSLIPNYGGALPKQYRSAAVGDIPDLGIMKLFRTVILGPSYSGKNNLCHHILKHSPHVFSHLHIIARNPDQELYDYLKDKLEGFVTFYDQPPNVDQISVHRAKNQS